MPRQYHYLVAGLREYGLESDHKGFDAVAVRQEIRRGISDRDRRYVDQLYRYYDIENILNLRRGGFVFNKLGNLTREKLEAELIQPVRLPAYLRRIIEAHADPENPEYEDVDTEKPLEHSLFEAYYADCEGSKCRFIREWNRFDRNLRNVGAALSARRMNRPIGEAVVGEGLVADALRWSSAADFGLKGEMQYIDQVIAAVSGDDNIIEKEHRIDLLRWNMAEELTPFDYFNIDRLLAYLVRVNIIHRWMDLDHERGEAMFLRLLESFDGRRLIDRAEKQADGKRESTI